MYTYVAYGLGIRSVLPLPELIAVAEAETDVVIRLGKVGRPRPETDHTSGYYHMIAAEAYFFWRGVGAFLVRSGKEITIEPTPGVEEQEIRIALLGMVLAAALQQRGFLALHASAVAMNGDAVAFLGSKGSGKSTMAAALYARGHGLVADDLVVLDVSGTGRPIVHPGFPQLKLFPKAAAASLGDDPEALPRLTPGYEKRARRAPDRFSLRPVPLKRMYMLGKGSAPEIAPMQVHEVIATLIGQSYVARVFKQTLKGEAASSHFRQCANLANRVPLHSLKRPASLAALPEIAHMVEEDLASGQSA